jgi:hypothetical protein
MRSAPARIATLVAAALLALVLPAVPTGAAAAPSDPGIVVDVAVSSRTLIVDGYGQASKVWYTVDVTHAVGTEVGIVELHYVHGTDPCGPGFVPIACGEDFVQKVVPGDGTITQVSPTLTRFRAPAFGTLFQQGGFGVQNFSWLEIRFAQQGCLPSEPAAWCVYRAYSSGSGADPSAGPVAAVGSVPSFTLLPASKLSGFAVSSTRVSKGSSIALSGRVRRVSTQTGNWVACARCTVTIYFNRSGPAPRKKVTTVTTGKKGVFSARVKPTRTGTWSARYVGLPTRGPAASKALKVRVRS